MQKGGHHWGHRFWAAGVTENLARERGFDFVAGAFEGVDRHPGTLPGAHKQLVKLIVACESGVIKAIFSLRGSFLLTPCIRIITLGHVQTGQVVSA